MKKQKHTETDFKKLENLKESEIDYSDIPQTDEEFWKDAEVVVPVHKKHISLRLDEDIIEFFKEGGGAYQSKINAVLKSYVHAKTKKHA